jgi:hypothetical protein
MLVVPAVVPPIAAPKLILKFRRHFEGLKTEGGIINSTGPTTPDVVPRVIEEEPWGVIER